nr:dynamin-related protein 4C-like [Tanacetum cinerariifolium]
EIAGEASGISNIPLTVVVKQKGLPNVTVVELPGITRVAVCDEPKDIHEQIP